MLWGTHIAIKNKDPGNSLNRHAHIPHFTQLLHVRLLSPYFSLLTQFIINSRLRLTQLIDNSVLQLTQLINNSVLQLTQLIDNSVLRLTQLINNSVLQLTQLIDNSLLRLTQPYDNSVLQLTQLYNRKKGGTEVPNTNDTKESEITRHNGCLKTHPPAQTLTYTLYHTTSPNEANYLHMQNPTGPHKLTWKYGSHTVNPDTHSQNSRWKNGAPSENFFFHGNLVKCFYHAALHTTQYDRKWYDTKFHDSGAIHKEKPHYLKTHMV